MKYLSLALLLALPLPTWAAAPDDISSNQRAWFDAVDINANNIYTDNPANNARISVWNDKSGSGNHLSQSGSKRPRYKQDSIATQRHGLLFDGVDDELTDANDIWTGAVNRSESYLVATTDSIQTSSLFASTDNHNNRLSTHVPWSTGDTY